MQQTPENTPRKRPSVKQSKRVPRPNGSAVRTSGPQQKAASQQERTTPLKPSSKQKAPSKTPRNQKPAGYSSKQARRATPAEPPLQQSHRGASRPQKQAGNIHKTRSPQTRASSHPQKKTRPKGVSGSGSILAKSKKQSKQNTAQGPQYTPMGTTYNTPGSKQGVFQFIGSVIAALFRLLLGGLAGIGHALASVRQKAPRLTTAAIAILVVIVVSNIIYTADLNGNAGKILPNVQVAGIDVSGKTKVEAIATIASVYEPTLEKDPVYLYANDEARANKAINAASSDNNSVTDERGQTVVWTATAETVQAAIDYGSLYSKAMEQGRGGIFDRIFLIFAPRNLDIPLNFNANAIENLAGEIDLSIGQPVLEYGVEVKNGHASVTDGHDGNIIPREWFQEQLKANLLKTSDEPREFTVYVEPASVHITKDAATNTADAINAAISSGANLTYNDQEWNLSASDLGDMISTYEIDLGKNGYRLAPYMKEESVKRVLPKYISIVSENSNASIGFSKQEDGTIQVATSNIEQIPQMSQITKDLDTMFFEEYRNNGTIPSIQSTPTVDISMTKPPSTMTFDEALSTGVISEIASFTTEYTASRTARNTNIHLAADLLNNSIVPANGGVWSFNETAGECNEEKGFVAAGSVIGNTTTDEIGGGICQVASTVFNAVFFSGFPVKQRVNHSIYIAAYPAGRDAAISWPSPDLKWINDSSSDVLVKMTYSDTTVTCTLYGIDPGYKVSYDTGEWKEGAEFKTVEEVDPNLAPGASYVESAGANGRSISVTRTVTDSSGAVLHVDTFDSNYSPSNRVVKVGR